MKHLIITTFAGLSLVAAPLAQSKQPTPQRGTDDSYSTTRSGQDKQSQKPDFVALDEIIGAKVTMHPGQEERREAAADGEVADRPRGKISDVLLAARSGEAQWAVIEFGGVLGIGDKTVAVPCDILTWNQAEEGFRADIEEDRLKTLPSFDLDKAREDGLDETVTVYTRHWHAVVPADKGGATKDRGTAEASSDKGSRGTSGKSETSEKGDKPEKGMNDKGVVITGTSMIAIPHRMICASEVGDLSVYGRNDEVGSIGKCIFDRNNRELALVVLKQGGVLGIGSDQYLVPFESFRLAARDGEKVLVLDKTKEAIKTDCVKYVEPEEGIVDPAAAKRACDAADKKMNETDKKTNDTDKGRRGQ